MSSLCLVFCNNLYKNSLITYPSTKTSELLSILSLFLKCIFHESVNSLIVSLENQEFEMSFNMRKASFDQHLRKISLKGMSSVQYISNVGVQRMTADVCDPYRVCCFGICEVSQVMHNTCLYVDST